MRISLGPRLRLFVGRICARRQPAATTAPTASAAGPSTGAAAGAVQNGPRAAVVLQCAKRARDVAGSSGTSWYVRCPADCGRGGTVWGTDVYTDDSAICPAAIHAGRLDARGGVALVT